MTTTTDDRHWQSYDDYDGTSDSDGREFGEAAGELVIDAVSRRGFLGTGAAVASAAALSGCLRKPEQKIVPYAKRPEDFIPGVPVYYATSFSAGATVEGLLVESHDGRPTKIEGNPQHAGSKGAASAWAQASVFNLYNLDRSEAPTIAKDGATGDATWELAWTAFDTFAKNAKADEGAGLAIVTGTVMSPTVRSALSGLLAAMPKAKHYTSDPTFNHNGFAASEAIGGKGSYVTTNLEGARVIAAFDADMLFTETNGLQVARDFAAGRRTMAPGDVSNRLYAVEPVFSLTGSMADHRLQARGADVGQILLSLAHGLTAKGVSLPKGVAGKLGAAPQLGKKAADFVNTLAADLAGAKGASAVVVGSRQPAWVHALGLAINGALGNNKHVVWRKDETWLGGGTPAELAAALTSGAATKVLCLDSNPAYTSSGALGLGEALAKAYTVHLGMFRDETAQLSKLHIPVSHYLEAWGDLQSLTGVTSMVQPLIAPLFHTPSVLEALGRLATGAPTSGYALVRDALSKRAGLNDGSWRKALHDGIVAHSSVVAGSAGDWAAAAALLAGAKAPGSGNLEVNFYVDPSVLDGRYANLGILQETPDPMTKLTWDNALLVSRKTANDLGLGDKELATITVGGKSLQVAVKLTPGQAHGTGALALGYGRKFGAVATGAGFDAYEILPADGSLFASATVTADGGSYELADTQPSGNRQDPGKVFSEEMFSGRPLALESTAASYKADPEQFNKKLDEVMPAYKVKSHVYDKFEMGGAQQWGMAIDLNTCIGCNACIVACTAENNISVVGKDQVLNGREMHWIRLDRYYTGDEDDPKAILQPLACQHCETAPCEAVCPVKATAHSPEGLNDMAYNRCIGTRYCANNCPYKVRRFNFFNFNLDIHPLQQMQKNPDVTIRFRGVMEKCTYCVQRINGAKIDAKVNGDGIIPDGGVVTACEQTCPVGAITFGDIKDPESRVSKMRSQQRNYQVLREFNTRPRTTYLAKLRNPNPDLA